MSILFWYTVFSIWFTESNTDGRNKKIEKMLTNDAIIVNKNGNTLSKL